MPLTRSSENEDPGFLPDFFLPDSTAEGLAGEMEWLSPKTIDPEIGKIIQAIQSFIIRTDHHTTLVEASVSNDKDRPSTPPWLSDLKDLGVGPVDVG